MAAPRLLQPHAAFVRLRRSRAGLSPAIPGRWPVLPRIRPAPEGGRQGPHCGGRLSWRWPVNLSTPGAARTAALPLPACIMGSSRLQEPEGRVLQLFPVSLAQKRLPRQEGASPLLFQGPQRCLTLRDPLGSRRPQPLPGAFRASHAALREQGVRSIQFCNWGILRPRLPGAAAGSLSSRPHPVPLTPGAA